MDRDFQSELMSAYLDGELTPAERAEAERLLETAPELRDELNDFARLSDLLRALPREAAPAELASAIRREAERKSLLSSESASPRRSWVRDLVVTMAAMAATVMAMLLLPQDALQRNSEFAYAPANRGVESEVALAEREERLAAERSVLSFGTAPEGIRRAEALGDLQAETAPVSSSLALRDAPPNAPAAAGFDADQDEGLSLGGAAMNSNSVQIGDMVPYFQNGVAVMEFTVVDVESALDEMVVVLGRNGLSVSSEKSANSPEDAVADHKLGLAKARQPGSEQQLMLVYVDASRETVAQVLSEMSQEQIFAQAKLRPPVEAPEDAELPLAESQREWSDKEPSPNEIPAEQVLVNDALVVSENYSRVRQQGVGQSIAADQTRRNFIAKDERNFDRSPADKSVKAASRMARGLSEFAVPAGDLPADAMLAQNTIAPMYRKQSGATVFQLNLDNGMLQNSAVMLEQHRSLEAKQDEAAKSGVARRQKDGAETERLIESPTEPTVRLLVVLQTPGAAPAP